MNPNELHSILRGFAKAFLIAVLYYLTARLGFLTALPPGNVTALWIPSGLALAAVFMWGWQIGIGVFIGSFIVNLETMNGPAAQLVAAAIAAGSTLQAWLGVWTLKRIVKVFPPETVRETLLSIGVLSLTTLLAPAFGVTSLCWAGFAGWSQFTTLAVTWWLGDLIGMLVFAPSLIILGLRWNKQKVRETFLWPLTCLLIGLSLFAFYVINNSERQRVTGNFARDSMELVHILEDSLDGGVQNLVAIRAFYASSLQISHEEFLTFTQPLLSSSPSNSGLEFIPRVTQAERAAYEAAIRASGFPEFYIYEKGANGNNIPAGDRAEYFPVTFINPFEQNKAAFGFDLGSDPARLETIRQVRDSGEAAVIAPLNLIKATGNESGILIIMPLYRNDIPANTIEERRANLIGFTLGVYRVEHLLEQALARINRHDIELYLYDAENPARPQFLAFSPSISGAQTLPASGVPTPAALQTTFAQTNTFEIGGRTWLVITRPGPKYAQSSSRWIAWGSLLIGFLIAGAFLTYVHNRQKNEAVLARSEAGFRALAEYALTGVARYELATGTVLYANNSAAQMFGYETANAFLGVNLNSHISDAAQKAELTDALTSANQVHNQIIEIASAQGVKRHLLCAATLRKSVVSVTFMDMTERVQSEQEIRKLSGVVSQMADSVVITDASGIIEYVNPAFERLTGYSAAEALGQTPRILKSDAHDAEFYENMWAVILRGEIFQSELVNRKKNGEIYHETKTITPIRNAEGQIVNFVATGKDTTGHKLIENALRRKEADYRLIADHTGDVIWVLDVESQKFTYVSPSVEKMRGYTPQEVLAQSMSEVLTPEALDYVSAELPKRLAAFAQNGASITYTDELDQIKKDGSIVNTEISTTFVLNDAGKLQVVGISRDITERKKAETLQQVVYHIAEAAQTTAALDDLYPQIHRQIARVMHAENFYIALYDESTDLLTFAYSVDEVDTFNQPIHPGNGLTAHVLRTGQSLFFLPGQGAPDIGLISTPCKVWVGVPLSVRGKTIGVMAVQNYKDASVYTERELHILEFVSSQVATAIDRKQAEAAQRQQGELLKYHYDLVEVLTSISMRFINLPVTQINAQITRALQQIGEFEKVDRSYVFILHQDKTLMDNTHEWCAPGIEPQMDNLHNVPTSLFPWWMNKMEHGEEVYIPAVSQLPREAQAEREILEPQSVQSLLAVPMISNGILIGFMGFDSVARQRAWTADTILLIKMAGDIISNALIRKQNEEALFLTEKRNSALIEHAPGGITLLDVDGKFTFGSPSAYRMFGYTPEELLGKNALKWLHPEDAAQIHERFVRLVKEPYKVFTLEYRFMHKDGTYRWVEGSFDNLLSEPGVNAVVNNFRDITERKQSALMQEMVYRIAEAAQNTESLQDLYPLIHQEIGKIMYARNFYIALHDEAANLIRFAYSVDEKYPDDTEPIPVDSGLTGYVLRTGKPLACNERKRDELRATGAYVSAGDPCKVWVGMPLIARGKTIGVMAVQHYTNENAYTASDQRALEYVSSQVATAIDRKQASELLQKSRVNLETAQAIARLGSWELDAQSGAGLFWSNEMYHLFQRDPALGAPQMADFMQLVHPDDRQLLLDAQQRAIETSAVVSVEYRAFPAGQKLCYFRANIQAVKNQNGQLLHMSGTVLDITESRLMEQAIKERVKELTCLFNVNRLMEDHRAAPEVICRKIIEFITPAMQFPELAIPMLVLDGVRYATEDFNEGLTHKLHAEIEVNSQRRGEVCVYYTQDAPFIIPEEQDMLQNVARMLGAWLEQREAEAAVKSAQRALEELNRDLEKLVEERTAEVRRNEATYRALFENSNDGIFLLSPTGEDITANPQALKILGFTLEEYLSRAHEDVNFVAVPEQRADADVRLAAILRGEFVPLYERTFVSKSGAKVDVEINLSPVRDSSGKVVMVQSVVRDITERKKAQGELRESRDKLSAANAALEKASHMKDEFLASMSHELRTPLTGILGLSEVLQMPTFGALTEKQLKAVRNIETSGRHLLELINDILDLSKIEAGKFDIQIEPCPVSDICQGSLQLVKGMAGQKKQNVAFSMNPVTINVRADRRRLKQMLVNLLSNAVKFTPEGGQLGLDVYASEEEKSVSFTVWDKGIGIHPDELGKLFQPFVQLDSKLSRQYSGTGLGLSLVQRMAELHGGSIRVESEPNVGSRFTILLPWSPESTQPLPDLIQRDPGNLKNALVVEDNDVDAERMTRYLKDLGIPNIIHPVIRGAMEKAALLQPSAILLDLNLPDGSGLGLLEKLKANPVTHDIPVIIASVEEQRAQALKLGAAGYLLKPVTLQDLRTELSKAAAFVDSSEPVLVVSAAQAAATVLIADDNEMILEMVADFLGSKGYAVIAARSGSELLERAQENRPDIMLVDIQMPGMDGLETMRRVRAHSDTALAVTPMIAVTALAMSGDRERCLAAGANEYISKPIVLTKLHETIKKLLKYKLGQL